VTDPWVELAGWSFDIGPELNHVTVMGSRIRSYIAQAFSLLMWLDAVGWWEACFSTVGLHISMHSFDRGSGMSRRRRSLLEQVFADGQGAQFLPSSDTETMARVPSV